MKKDSLRVINPKCLGGKTKLQRVAAGVLIFFALGGEAVGAEDNIITADVIATMPPEKQQELLEYGFVDPEDVKKLTDEEIKTRLTAAGTDLELMKGADLDLLTFMVEDAVLVESGVVTVEEEPVYENAIENLDSRGIDIENIPIVEGTTMSINEVHEKMQDVPEIYPQDLEYLAGLAIMPLTEPTYVEELEMGLESFKERFGEYFTKDSYSNEDLKNLHMLCKKKTDEELAMTNPDVLTQTLLVTSNLTEDEYLQFMLIGDSEPFTTTKGRLIHLGWEPIEIGSILATKMILFGEEGDITEDQFWYAIQATNLMLRLNRNYKGIDYTPGRTEGAKGITEEDFKNPEASSASLEDNSYLAFADSEREQTTEKAPQLNLGRHV